jgi:hypothetical protein
VKKIAIYLLLASLSMSASAITGHGFTIISETHKVTPGAQGSIKRDVGAVPGSNGEVAAVSSTSDAHGKKNTNIGLKSHHTFSIRNLTGGPQRYKVHYELVTHGMSSIHDIELEIRAQGYAVEGADVFLAVNFPTPAQYPINADTKISGPHSDFFRSNAKLTITN